MLYHDNILSNCQLVMTNDQSLLQKIIMIIRQQQTQCSAQAQNVNYIHTQIKPHVNIINCMNIQILIVNIIIIRNMT